MSEYKVIEAILDSDDYDSKIHPGAETGQCRTVTC